MVAAEVELAINTTKLPDEAKEILHGLASSWTDVLDAKSLEVVQMKGAMTNDVYRIKWIMDNKYASRQVLVRVYGKGADILFDRADEVCTFEYMSNHGQGPLLLGRFTGGRIEEFIHAKTLSAPDIRDPKISACIAAKLREFHDINMPGPKNILIWDRMRKWLKSAVDLCSPEEADEFLLADMEKEICFLQKKLHNDNQRMGFCHNDLQYGNIMMDEETRSLTLIDYDYAGYNPIAYDIANHFCEMAADYHCETPHLLDFDKYPELGERKRFVQTYLASSCNTSKEEVNVDVLMRDVEKYTLASHLSWCLWGLISDHVNKSDFDYMEYARQRSRQYWLMKPILLRTLVAP